MNAIAPFTVLRSADDEYAACAEQSVIGSLLLDNQRWDTIADLIGVDDLYRREHRLIFSAISALCQENSPADIVTVSERLKRTDDLDAAGGLAYLGSLANDTPSAANVLAYAKIVRVEACQRRLKAAAAQITSGNLSPDAIENLERAISDLQEPDARCLAQVDLGGLDVPTRYAIQNLLPIGNVALLSGHGGVGKSGLALTLAAHIAAGASWSGFEVMRGKVLFVSLEDNGDLIRFRLRRICEATGLSYDDVLENMSVLDGADADSVIATELSKDGTRRLVFTKSFEEIDKAAVGATLVVIDGVSDAFDSNENDRRMVRAFVRRFYRLARHHDCAVMLLAHIDKHSARYGGRGNAYSGSTAWHNSVRSRLALTDDKGGIQLVQEKLNLGRMLEGIYLRWSDEGVLIPQDENPFTANQDAKDDAAVLDAIRAAIADGQTVRPVRTGAYSAFVLLKNFPELPKVLRENKERFWYAVTRLERAGHLKQQKFRTEDRKKRKKFVCGAPLPPYPPTGAPARPVGGPADAPVPS